MLVRQAGYPNRRPGGDRETQHQDSLYRDWRRRAQMVIMSIVVGIERCGGSYGTLYRVASDRTPAVRIEAYSECQGSSNLPH
jgi:hypothetical protein